MSARDAARRRDWRYWFATRVVVPDWLWRITPCKLRERVGSWGYR